MQIDGNRLALLQDEVSRTGSLEESIRIGDQFLKMVKESGDYCPCHADCALHGDCFSCVQVHRGHRGHLPLCMWDMVNERIAGLASLTEGSFRKYDKDHPGCMNGAPNRESGMTLDDYYEQYPENRIEKSICLTS